jgi:hypothetical protein
MTTATTISNFIAREFYMSIPTAEAHLQLSRRESHTLVTLAIFCQCILFACATNTHLPIFVPSVLSLFSRFTIQRHTFVTRAHRAFH